jgi:hypothetical protein
MRNRFIRILGLSAAAMLLASTAQAQGKGHDKEKDKNKDNGKARAAEVRRSDGVIIRDGNHDVYGNRVNVPPGLAKKPGQMPPGQYKKRYGANDGAIVLDRVMRRRGYSVLRVVPAGNSQYVYYRLRDGSERRAIVSPGTDRLVFQNVPTSLLQEVLAALY